MSRGRKKSNDTKMKISINARSSFLERIDVISYNTNIRKTDILELCLENSIPMLERLAEKIRLMKENPT